MAYVYPDEDDDDKVESVAFEYNGNGLRTKAVEGNIVTQYYYDGLNVLFEKDASGQTKRSYIRKFDFPGGIGGLIAMKRYKLKEKDGNNANGKMYYYHYDALGSVVKLTDEKGKFRAGYNYDAFGNNLKRGKTGNSYRFSSKEWEPHAGLYYFGARYYDPRIGRFLQTDPIGYLSDINLYSYVGNNPVNFIDPFGFYREKKDKSWKRHWRAWSDFVVPDFDDPTSFGANFWTIFYQERAWQKWHIDVGYTGGGLGKLRPGVNTGFKLAPFYGFYGYFGIGLGAGKGFTGTLEPGIPTKGIAATATGRYGLKGGMKVSGTYGEEGISVVPSFGLGIGKGVAVTGTGTYEILIWRRE